VAALARQVEHDLAGRRALLTGDAIQFHSSEGQRIAPTAG